MARDTTKLQYEQKMDNLLSKYWGAPQFLSQIMIVDWDNLKKRLISLFGNEGVRERIKKRDKKPSQVLNYKFGDHVYNLFLSFLGVGETCIENLLDRNVRILIYGAWELDDKWLKRIRSFLERKGNDFEEDLIIRLWEKGFLYEKGLKKLISEFLKKKDIKSPDLWERKLIDYLEKHKPFITIRRGVVSIVVSNKSQSLKQKRVDMLMGIDMTSYSFRLNPVEFLLICNDQDILPALKVAKRNGAVISSCFFEEEKANEDILCHSDRVRVLRLTELNGGLGKMKIMNGKINAW